VLTRYRPGVTAPLRTTLPSGVSSVRTTLGRSAIWVRPADEEEVVQAWKSRRRRGRKWRPAPCTGPPAFPSGRSLASYQPHRQANLSCRPTQSGPSCRRRSQPAPGREACPGVCDLPRRRDARAASGNGLFGSFTGNRGSGRALLGGCGHRQRPRPGSWASPRRGCKHLGQVGYGRPSCPLAGAPRQPWASPSAGELAVEAVEAPSSLR